MVGKRVQFDDETWQALDLLARDRMSTFQELADEAFRDLLEKHGRPTDLKTPLWRSLPQESPQIPPAPTNPRRPGLRRPSRRR